MARTGGIAIVVGAAPRHGAAGRSLVHQRRPHLCRSERIERNRRGRGRSALSAHRNLGAHVQRLRIGRRLPSAIRCDSTGCGRPAERRAQTRNAARHVALCAHRGQGPGAAGGLADRDAAAAQRYRAVEELRRQHLSARTDHARPRACAQCRAHHRTRGGHGVARRASFHRGHSHARRHGRHLDREFLRGDSGRPLGARRRIHARRHGRGVSARAGASWTRC